MLEGEGMRQILTVFFMMGCASEEAVKVYNNNLAAAY